MAWSLNEATFGELVDPFERDVGPEDGIIRTPCDPEITFSDDPLRMMRAVRFASQLGFTIEEETFEAIRRNAERIRIVSRERIVTELNKIVLSPVPSMGFELLELTGLLELIFPNCTTSRGSSGGAARPKDNFFHTLKVLDNVARRSDDLWLRWAADAARHRQAADEGLRPEGGWTFPRPRGGRLEDGARAFSGAETALERAHEVRAEARLPPPAAHHPLGRYGDRLCRAASAVRGGDDVESLMTLCEADITSGIDAKVKRYLANFELVRRKMKDLEERDRIRNFQPPITGELIMETYGIGPCRVIGDIKEVIKNAILDGEIPNEYDAAYALMERLAAEWGLTKVKP